MKNESKSDIIQNERTEAERKRDTVDYLFFDIECANCFNGNGKICSFGYVIADERLRITEQRDIVVNPRQKFHLHSRNGACDIELAYPTETFRQAPDFPYFYEEISQMLTAPDRFVFGHSVDRKSVV